MLISFCSGKGRTIYKQIREHNENSQIENKVLLTKNDRVYSVEEADSSIENCEGHISGTNMMSESDRNICNKYPDVTDLPTSIEEMVIQKNGKGDTFGIAANAVAPTAELETEFYIDEESEDTNAVQNKTDGITQ